MICTTSMRKQLSCRMRYGTANASSYYGNCWTSYCADMANTRTMVCDPRTPLAVYGPRMIMFWGAVW